MLVKFCLSKFEDLLTGCCLRLRLVAAVEDAVGLEGEVAVVGGYGEPVIPPHALGHVGAAVPAHHQARAALSLPSVGAAVPAHH
jgi:hypothetical protein